MKRFSIGVADVGRMFRLDTDVIPASVTDELAKIDTCVEWVDTKGLSEYTLQYLKKIDEPRLERSRDENQAAFERGWSEVLANVTQHGLSLQNLRPGYFRGSRFLRYGGGLVCSENAGLEFDLFGIARSCLFAKYLAGYDNIVEIGCGSCQNLYILAQMFGSANIYGSDWTRATLDIADLLANEMKRKIVGFHLDMLEPRTTQPIPEGAAVVTVHALEQIGRNFEGILTYIRGLRPSIVLHYEPVLDFYDSTDLLDYLALKYCTKRGYLQGYYERLVQLEAEGEIELLSAWRPQLGGVLHEASVLAWRPVQ